MPDPAMPRLARELATRIAEWLPSGYTLDTRHHEEGDRVEVTIAREPEHGERRTWRRGFNRLELERGIDQAAGAVLHQAGLEKFAFRVWRGERAPVETVAERCVFPRCPCASGGCLEEPAGH